VLAGRGYERLIVAHGDLPLARTLAWVADFDGVTIVPDRWGRGTNVLAVPSGVGFDFHYGTGSAALHRAEAERLGLAHRTVVDEQLAWDIDTPADLDDLEAPLPHLPAARR
jgi:2-phospho-L-lactate guanylyltransferase